MKVWFLCDARVTVLFGQCGQTADQFAFKKLVFMSAARIQWKRTVLLQSQSGHGDDRGPRVSFSLFGKTDASDAGFSASSYSLQRKQKN